MRPRPLTLDDVPAAAELCGQAFSRPPPTARIRRYLELEPGGWFGLEQAGALLAMAGVIRYGAVAWLGLMAVRPDQQGRGLGRRMAGLALEWAGAQGSRTVCLIATPQGLPLYRKLGFVEDGDSKELAAPPGLAGGIVSPGPPQVTVHPWTAADTGEVARFDAPSFGADRERALALYAREFSGSSFVARDDDGTVQGFLLVQEEMLGPWTARDAPVAEALLDRGLAGVNRPLRAGVADGLAVTLLERRGWVSVRALPRLRLGPPVPRTEPPHWLAYTSYAAG